MKITDNVVIVLCTCIFTLGIYYTTKSFIEPRVIETEKVVIQTQIIKEQPVFYEGIKVNGSCDLVEPPCWKTDWQDFPNRLLKIK